jgi:hypothetical protein
MKKILFLISAFMMMMASPIKADTTQTLIINGEVVEKVVTKITFEGDLAVLTFADETFISEDMGNVVMQFTASPTSIKNVEAFQLNKAVGDNMEIDGLVEGTQVQVFDATGKQVIVTNDPTINVSSLKPGMYILKAGNQIVKFAKK